MRALYICYFGLREPLVQTQVLPYLRRLVAADVDVFLLTFEPEPKRSWSRAEAERWAGALLQDGIQWSWLTYHKRPSLPATVYDMLIGAWAAGRLVRRHRIDLLHGRAHVAAVIGGIVKSVAGGKLVFDIRGFNPEEYVDAGVWRPGCLKFRLAKRAERWLFRVSDGFVVLTDRAREILFPGYTDSDGLRRPIEVIPCCVDGERFRAADIAARDAIRAELGLEGRRVLAYVGALGGFYLTEELLKFLAAAHRQDPSTFSVILTQSPALPVIESLGRLGVPDHSTVVRRVPPADIPRWLRAADFGLSFIKPTYSKQASSPTKVAEYLASGVPVIANAGVGDLDGLIENDRVGVVLRGFTPADCAAALDAAEALQRDPTTAERCVASAKRRFDLDAVGAVRYRRLYQRIAALPERGGRHPHTP